jgi:hypothetical protein
MQSTTSPQVRVPIPITLLIPSSISLDVVCDIPHTCPPNQLSHLPAAAPDALQEAILLGQSVHRVVALAHGAHEAGEGICLVLAGVAAVLVNLADGDLYGGVVLGLDDAAGGAAFAGDVATIARQYSHLILWYWGGDAVILTEEECGEVEELLWRGGR